MQFQMNAVQQRVHIHAITLYTVLLYYQCKKLNCELCTFIRPTVTMNSYEKCNHRPSRAAPKSQGRRFNSCQRAYSCTFCNCSWLGRLINVSNSCSKFPSTICFKSLYRLKLIFTIKILWHLTRMNIFDGYSIVDGNCRVEI